VLQLNVNVDAARVLLQLEGIRNGAKRFAYAIERGGNETLKLIQRSEFEHVEDRLTIRKPAFFFGTPLLPGGAAARITAFFSVKKARPFGEVAIQAPSLKSGRQLLLAEFEHGGVRRPFPLLTPRAKHIAVPITGRPARPTFKGGVPPEFTIAALKITAFRGKKRVRRPGRKRRAERGFGDSGSTALPTFDRAGVQWKGLHRTFVLTHAAKAPFGGVFQRFGPARGDVRTLYAFEPPFPLEDRLDWEGVARRVSGRWFAPLLQAEVDASLRYYGLTRPGSTTR
jgi:hypothetical protein